MNDIQRLPTKEQINAIDDIEALYEIRDEVDRRKLSIEAQLEHLDGTDEWASRAVNALAAHRYADRILGRRIAQLIPSRPNAVAVRPHDASSSLTIEVLTTRPTINVMGLETLSACDERAEWLNDRINAVLDDREDEIGLSAGDRDEAFLAATGSLLRTMKGLRVAVQQRRADLRKAEKAAIQRVIDQSREQLFVDAARRILDRDTFLRIWLIVDQVEPR